MRIARKTERPDSTRRDFLAEAAAALGLGWGLPLLATGCGGSTTAAGRHLVMVVDVEKCRREEVRRACIEACDSAHNVPRIPKHEHEVKWIWTEEYRRVFPELVHDRTSEETLQIPVMVLCNHCTDPACVKVCPTGATWKREADGIVMMDMHRCIGCRYCMAACPYGARSFNWCDPRPYIAKDGSGRFPSAYPTRTRGVVEKCTFCTERILEGLPPACVEAASKVEGGKGALTFGDLSQPSSEVIVMLRERRTVTRRSALGTGPNVFYAL